MQKPVRQVFSPDIPPDLEHAFQIREDAVEWLESQADRDYIWYEPITGYYGLMCSWPSLEQRAYDLEV